MEKTRVSERSPSEEIACMWKAVRALADCRDEILDVDIMIEKLYDSISVSWVPLVRQLGEYAEELGMAFRDTERDDWPCSMEAADVAGFTWRPELSARKPVAFEHRVHGRQLSARKPVAFEYRVHGRQLFYDLMDVDGNSVFASARPLDWQPC